MAYMNLNYTVSEHATALPSNVLSQNYAGHIFNVKLTSDCDNGNLLGVGDWLEFDVFEEAAAPAFSGKIVQQMPNGNWLVLVTAETDAVLCYQKPLTAVESPRELTREEAMYNKEGDIVRCYQLHKWDRFEVSALAFNSEPEVGKAITGVANKKMTLAS